MSDIASGQVIDGVAVLAFDGRDSSAFVESVERVNADDGVDAIVVILAAPDTDDVPPPEVVDAVEASGKPVVAAIGDKALGSTLEMAMGCHYRVAAPEAELGLPAVKLALMPGAGGTQRLPRLVGVQRALDMIALGDPVDAVTAKAIGLVDEVADDPIPAAAAFARGQLDRSPRRTRNLAVAPVPGEVYEAFAARNARKFRGFDAPPAIITAVRTAAELPFEEGARRERELFLKLREGPQSKALRHVAFAEEAAGKVPGLEGVTPRRVDRVGLIGAGTMGCGIAIALLSGGLSVTLYERDAAALERGVARVRETLDGNVRAGRMNRERADAASAALAPTLSMADMANADLVIEAAFETMEVKQAIFAELDRVLRPGAVLASNTSYLDLDAIAGATKRPQDVIGLHLFSPANVMKLLEVVRGAKTAPDVLATALALARRLGKIAVVSGNAWGFIGNRMLAVRRREAEAMVVEGASPQQIDRVLEDFGFPMGPLKVGDLAGLDLGWSIENSTGSTIRERLCEAGRRGQKTGKGFYDYDDSRRPVASAEAEEIVARFAKEMGTARRVIDDAEVLDRLLWPMADEGARLLGEGIATRASDIDVVWLNGYGWPVWTGGPMYHAKMVGIDAVCERLVQLGHQPSDALRHLQM